MTLWTLRVKWSLQSPVQDCAIGFSIKLIYRSMLFAAVQEIYASNDNILSD